MDCPTCKYPDMRAIDTRQQEQNTIRRRRECTRCGNRITTEEVLRVKPKEKQLNVAEIITGRS